MVKKPMIKNLADLSQTHLRQAVEIFAASFYEPLSFISPDVDVIADILQHSFVPSNHFVALLDGNVVSVVSFSTTAGRSHRFQHDHLVDKLGFVRGTIVFFRLRGVLEKPLDLDESQCYIDSVATDTAFRGMGVSSELQRYLLRRLPYKEFLLEVAESNFKAIRMYEELGFTVEERKAQRSFWKPNSEGGKLSLRKQVVTDKAFSK
ncbi:GNAT family N-acetyltransferase [Pleomorphochaeta sp. DL1XJH-081]|uniref:GNAT family N-acetyltransferase n=1 Tax=Pleomorphochaeta sp. DL1XJH-081 TaxID=3409690 RepID=UPI003BB50A55